MKKLCLLFVTLALSLTAWQANAELTFIHLGDTVGQPSDVPSEFSRLQTLVAYNQLRYPSFPMPSVETGWVGTQTIVENGGRAFTYDFTGFSGYMLLKWGNQDCFYYIGKSPLSSDDSIVSGDVHTFYSDNYNRSIWNGEVPQPVFSGIAYAPMMPAGLSHYTLFTDTTVVPEPSTLIAGALLLIPFAASTVRIVRRNRQ